MCTLSEAMDCENEDLILEGFMARYDVTKEEAQDIFNETKKWLWLAAHSKELTTSPLFIDKSLIILDEMWHNFLLYTKPYYDYCMKKFNRLIHHFPSSQTEKQRYKKAYATNPQTHEKKIKKQYAIIYDHLGPDTLIKWYDTIANKYTPEYIQTIKKH